MQCIVSACARKYFMETQPFSLNLAFFIFQLRQWALESQSVFGYLQTLIFEPETSKLLMNLSQESSFQSKKNQKTAKVKFNKRTDFLWFKSWLFAWLNCSLELNLWCSAETTVFFFHMISWNYHDQLCKKLIFNLSITY